ncbi:DNA-binding barrel domain superfamily [Sesbania bispinosa]|nr:DNA-binding barrel domain superfamily [Sesbania bispinosa]
MIEPTFWEKLKGDIPQSCVLIGPTENVFPVSVVDNGHSVAFVKGVDNICRLYRLEETHNVLCTHFRDDEFEIVLLNDLGPVLLWRVNLSKAAASGKNVMPIPARLVTSLLDGTQIYVDIIDEDSNRTSCKLLRPKRRSTERNCESKMSCHIFPAKRPTLGMFESKFYAFKGKIDIDQNFWSKWRSHLPSEVYFTDPVGNSFLIGISSKGDSVVFKRNVNTMVRFYGLNRKHSVLFCYKGGNQFYILVGNRYEVEIKYPQKPSEVLEISSDDSETDHEGHVNSVDDGSDPEDFPFWTMTMSKSSTSGRNALVIGRILVVVSTIRSLFQTLGCSVKKAIVMASLKIGNSSNSNPSLKGSEAKLDPSEAAMVIDKTFYALWENLFKKRYFNLRNPEQKVHSVGTIRNRDGDYVFYIGVQYMDNVKVNVGWTVKVTKAIEGATNPLPIPARIVKSILKEGQQMVYIFDEDGNALITDLRQGRRRGNATWEGDGISMLETRN